MIEFALDIVAAVWLGVLTSISPCPMATNIAAISFVGRKVDNPRWVFLAGLLYTAGRALAYIAVGVLVCRSLQTIPGVSIFLQKYMNRALGPILVAVGLLLLDFFKFSFNGGVSGRFQSRIDRMGLWGAGLLGAVFALAFCPVSAGLFFGGLIPLALRRNALLISALFGVGTAVPVVAFSLILAFAAHLVGITFNVLTVVEVWVRRVTALTMVLIGIYLILTYNFGLHL